MLEIISSAILGLLHLNFVGMGTKVQFKSYLPSYNLERNQNELSRRSSSCYYEDNILNSSLYVRPLLNQANGYSLCDKELLKHMMLEHEATFRKQVYELHRLYRLQKELMNEFKNTSQTNLFAQVPSEAAEKIWQMPQLCALSSHAAGNDNIKSIPKYVKESGSSIQIGEFLEPKVTGLPRKKFDLHLPAEVYIDIDDDAIAEKGNNSSPWIANPSNITCNADSNTNVKLALGRNKADDVPSRLGLADLNEPIEASSYVEEEGLTSSQVIGANSEQDEFNSSILSKDLLMDNHGNKQMLLNSVNTYQGEHCHGWTSSTNALAGELRSNANGSHGGLCYREFSVISKLVQEKPKISYEFVLPGQNKIDKWIGEKPSPGTETCQGFSKLPNLNTSGLAAPQMTCSLSDNSSITSLSISSYTKQNVMKNTPIEVQSHTSLNKYAVINPSDSVLHVIPKQQNFKGELSSCQNGFHQELKEDGISSSSHTSHDAKAERDMAVEEHKQLNCNAGKSASNKEVNLQQTDRNHEELVREAAENLVLMSIPASCDTLHWFADFVSSAAVSAGISREKSPCNYNGDDGLDIFEYRTLELKEVQEKVFFGKLQENQKYEAASLLLTKPRRGQAKKSRQRRDFQKDILPGLASLSRHEVTEDLQSLGGLMKASGKSWQASSSRRKTNPKEPNWQARGRRRPRSLAIIVPEIHIGSSTEEEQAQTKQVISSAGILGWGRTTRRCHRQRLLPGDFSVPLV